VASTPCQATVEQECHERSRHQCSNTHGDELACLTGDRRCTARHGLRTTRLFQASREDVLVIGQLQLEQDVDWLSARKPRRGNLEYAVFLRHSVHIAVGGDGEFCVPYGLTRLEIVKKDSKALPTR
jgi:hypothetical protein